MVLDYTRRQNTDGWWKVHINRLIEGGEELKEFNLFRAFEDILDYKSNIDRWLEKAEHEVHLIYKESSVVDEYCPPIAKVELQNISWSEAIRLLKDTVLDRIEGFKELIAKTE